MQMFEVAFSRRMCCSRVWSVKTQQRLPLRSVGLADDPSGHLADVLFPARHDSRDKGRRNDIGLPKPLPLGDHDIGAIAPRPSQHAEADRVDADDGQRPLAVRHVDERLRRPRSARRSSAAGLSRRRCRR